MTRKAQPKACRRCGATLLAGPDADRAALMCEVDPYPLTHRGELHAVVAGRRTYDLDLAELHDRSRWTLHRPARCALAEHRCWDPLPADWRAPAQAVTGVDTEGVLF